MEISKIVISYIRKCNLSDWNSVGEKEIFFIQKYLMSQHKFKESWQIQPSLIFQPFVIPTVIWEEGCFQQIKEYVISKVHIFGGVAMGLAIIQVGL